MNEKILIHSFQVSDIAKKIAEELGLIYIEVIEISIAALYHDIGKEYIPDIILSKTNDLSDDEYKIIKLHTKLGNELLSKFNDKTMQLAAEVALNHHEHYDGTGYYKKRYDQVSLATRIIAVADVYSALISDRVYRPKWEKDDALIFMRDNTGTRFDPNVISAFMRIEGGKYESD